MALIFNCSHCSRPVSVRFLKAGELARCNSCGEKTVVPPNATAGEHIEIERKIPLGWSTPSTSSTIISASKESLTGVPRLIRNMLVIGLIQVALLTISINVSSPIIDVAGRRLMSLGNSVIEIKRRQGVELVNYIGAGQRYWPDELLFLLIKEPLDSGQSVVVLADYFAIDENKTLQELADYIVETDPDAVVSIEVAHNRLEVVTGGEDPYGFVYYCYSKIYRVFPYYFRLQAFYGGDPEPPVGLLETVKTVEVSRR